MSKFEKIDPAGLPGNIFSQFNDGWALISAGTPEKWNTMTISWGTAGWLWYKPVCIAYVRESRYTTQFTEKNDCFSVAFFGKGEYRAELRELGSKSGRDMDKMNDSGLTPEWIDGVPAFAEAQSVLVCRKLYADWVKPENFLDESVQKQSYGPTGREDMHRVYVAEVTGAYIRK